MNEHLLLPTSLCTGCGTCVAACPLSAVHMKEHRGLYLAHVSQDDCNGCGVCDEVCPGFSLDFLELSRKIFGEQRSNPNTGHIINCYIGHAADFDIRYYSSSGGIVTALLLYLLRRGYIDGALVTRIDASQSLRPIPFIATSEKEIMLSRGSKYAPVPLNSSLKDILARRGKFAVVGLPCHIQGLRKFEQVQKRLKEKITFRIALFCSHTDSFLATDFLLRWLKIPRNQITDIAYRGYGWKGALSIKLEAGSTIFVPFDKYIVIHELNLFTPERCFLCFDKVGNFADIACGDAWGFSLEDDKIGHSLIITRTEEGERLLREAVRDGVIKIIREIEKDKVEHVSQFSPLKLRRVRANILLNTSLRRVTPAYSAVSFPNLGFLDVLLTILYRIANSIASHKPFWRIMFLILPSIKFLLRRVRTTPA